MDFLVFIIVPALLLPIFLYKSHWGLIALLFIVVFFREGWHPALLDAWTIYEVEIANLHIMELAVSLLLGVELLKKTNLSLRTSSFWLPPYTSVLLFFFVVNVIAAFYGMLETQYFREAFRYGEWRALWVGLILLVLVPNILNNKAKIYQVYNALFLFATVRCFWGFANYLFGSGVYHVTMQKKIVFWDSGENILFAILICTAIAEWLLSKKVTIVIGLKLLVSMIMFNSMLLSFRRSYWLFLAASLMVLFLFLSTKQKFKVVTVGIAGLVVLIVLLSAGFMKDKAELIIERGKSFFTSQDTNSFHIYDIYDAFLTISKQPITGVGFGNRFTRVKTRNIPGVESIPTNYVHNSYLYIWLKMGIFGLLLFLILIMVYITYSLQGIWKMRNGKEKALSIGLFVNLFGMLAIIFWGNDLFANTRNPMILFSIMGMVVAIVRNDRMKFKNGVKGDSGNLELNMGTKNETGN